MQRTNHLPRKRGSILCIILFAVVAVGCSGYSVAAPMSPELLALSAELRESPKIAVGYDFVLAVKGGEIYGWGTNQDILTYGDGGLASWSRPVVIPIPDEVISVSAGLWHGVALTTKGEVWVWGRNVWGALGVVHKDSTLMKAGYRGKNSKYKPFKITHLPYSISISTNVAHTLVLTKEGDVWAWGLNDSGQSNKNQATEYSEPHQIHGLPPINTIFTGLGNSFATSEKALYIWGSVDNGLIKNNSVTNKAYIPIELDVPCRVVDIDSGLATTFVCKDGRLKVIGRGVYGVLGLGNQKDSKELIDGPNIGNVLRITGNDRKLALVDNGTVIGWGHNNYGVPEFNNGYQSKPKKIKFPYRVVDIRSRSYNAYLVAEDGKIYRWISGKSWWVKGLYKFFDGYSFETLKDKDGKDFYLFENGTFRGEIK